ncbi:transposase [Streptomyces sp. NPDC059900]|uniref:IS701 family transposase n=1 Tax=Streptomyces sp. NPDC059900 TaxID=3155816 RepID=UPI003438AAAD
MPARPHRITRAFVEPLFRELPRHDQRGWAEAYLTGLLTVPGKKTVRRMAEAVHASPTAALALQQFINASPWPWAPVRRELARLVEQDAPVRAWTVRTAALPKRGDHSAGVHRRFVAAARRTINCQLGVGLFLSTESEDLPVDWRLLLPRQWVGDKERAATARVPESARSKVLAEHILDLVDAAPSRLPAAPVVADLTECHDGSDPARLMEELEQRGHTFLLAVPAGHPVAGPTDARRPHTITSLRRTPAHPPSGARGPLRAFHARRPDGSPGVWVTNLPRERSGELAVLAGLPRRAAGAVVELREYGLQDFEGRSFPGWHHHMTLVSAAYAHDRLAASGPARHGAVLPAAG